MQATQVHSPCMYYLYEYHLLLCPKGSTANGGQDCSDSCNSSKHFFFLWELSPLVVKSTKPILQTHSVPPVSWMEGTTAAQKAVLHKALFTSHSHIRCLTWATEKSGFQRASQGRATPKNLILPCGIGRAGSIICTSKCTSNYPNIKSSTNKRDYVQLFQKHFKVGAVESLRAMKKGQPYSFGV